MADLKFASTDGVGRVVFDRPNALNALSPSTLRDLIDLCADFARNDSMRVVVLEGSGACFSAGADLPAFLLEVQGHTAHDVADLGRRATEAVAGLPQITVAGVRGHCVGGGLVLAGACDIRIAADDSRFAIPELEAGIPLGWGAMGHLARLVGETVAWDWVLSGRPFGADEALRAGLISRIVPVADFERELGALAATIERKPRKVLRITKGQILAIREGRFDARTDADALLSSLRDPESQQAGLKYVAERIQGKGDDA